MVVRKYCRFSKCCRCRDCWSGDAFVLTQPSIEPPEPFRSRSSNDKSCSANRCKQNCPNWPSTCFGGTAEKGDHACIQGSTSLRSYWFTRKLLYCFFTHLPFRPLGNPKYTLGDPLLPRADIFADEMSCV